MSELKQKEVKLTDTGLETVFKLGQHKVFLFERFTTPDKILFSKIQDPEKDAGD